jgi:hypothetical protein
VEGTSRLGKAVSGFAEKSSMRNDVYTAADPLMPALATGKKWVAAQRIPGG